MGKMKFGNSRSSKPFIPKSGKTTTFKMMGSSPAKRTDVYTADVFDESGDVTIRDDSMEGFTNVGAGREVREQVQSEAQKQAEEETKKEEIVVDIEDKEAYAGLHKPRKIDEEGNIIPEEDSDAVKAAKQELQKQQQQRKEIRFTDEGESTDASDYIKKTHYEAMQRARREAGGDTKKYHKLKESADQHRRQQLLSLREKGWVSGDV